MGARMSTMMLGDASHSNARELWRSAAEPGAPITNFMCKLQGKIMAVHHADYPGRRGEDHNKQLNVVGTEAVDGHFNMCSQRTRFPSRLEDTANGIRG